MDVLYQPNLLQIRRSEDINFDLENRLLRTTDESWSYEQEVRLFAKLNDPPSSDGFRWMEFSDSLKLKEVIIGAQCNPAVSTAVVDTVKQFGDSVECYWAGMRHDAFLLVKQHTPPEWHASIT